MEAYEHRHDLKDTNAVRFDGHATDNISLLRGEYLKAQLMIFSSDIFCGLYISFSYLCAPAIGKCSTFGGAGASGLAACHQQHYCQSLDHIIVSAASENTKE